MIVLGLRHAAALSIHCMQTIPRCLSETQGNSIQYLSNIRHLGNSNKGGGVPKTKQKIN